MADNKAAALTWKDVEKAASNPCDMRSLIALLPWLIEKAKKVEFLENEVKLLRSRLSSLESLGRGQENLQTDRTAAALDEEGQNRVPLSQAHQQSVLNRSSSVVTSSTQQEAEYEKTNSLTESLNGAAREGNLEGCQVLLEAKASVNMSEDNGTTPLISAVENKQKHVVAYLLNEAKADVDGMDNDGRVPLDAALNVGHLGCIKLLISARASLNEPDASSAYPIFKAFLSSTKSQAKILSLLVQAKANVNQNSKEEGATPLIVASFSKASDCTAILIKAAADLEHQNRNGNTALMGACYSGDVKSAKILLDAKASANTYDRNRNTALHLATTEENLPIIVALIEAKANINAADSLGDTALTLAAEIGNLEIAATLVGSSADINHENNDGSTALTLAVQTGGFECADMLIDCGADVAYSNHEGVSPLTVMADEQNFEGVSYLMERVVEKFDWTLVVEARDILKTDEKMEEAVLRGCENFGEALTFEIKTALPGVPDRALSIVASLLNPAPCLLSGDLTHWIEPPPRTKRPVSLKDQLQMRAHTLRKVKRQNRVKQRGAKKDDMFSGLRQMLQSRANDIAGDESDGNDDNDDDSDFD